MSEIKKEWVEAFREAWLKADSEGKSGHRIEAGLRAVFDLVKEDAGFICPNHNPVQHRDGKEPWCKDCGLNAQGEEPKSRFKGMEKLARINPHREES